MMTLILGVAAYLIGSLSSAIIVCRLFKLPDPRTEGSMNPGTTNVLRIGGKIPALLTLLGDVLKGFLPVAIAHAAGISGIFLGLIAVAAFLGHLFPIFFNFQGGKGAATALGAFMALSHVVAFSVLLCWILVIAITRYVSLGSITAAIIAPILILFFSNKAFFIPALIIALIITWRHRENIKRLSSGIENKINF
jgi:acyl phosphate:glycerol-3-phosphate acyltransferase